MDFGPDIFKTENVKRMFGGKTVIFMGDSNIRSLYKDMLLLSQKNVLMNDKDLKAKLEESFMGDKLIFRGEQTNGRDFREIRQYDPARFGSYKSFFIYLTRVFDDYLRQCFTDYITPAKPDVIIMNSCLWDISRWGPSGIKNYKENVVSLVKFFHENLPRHCVVVWLTTPPISQELRGGFLVEGLDFLKYTLRFHVGEANFYCAQVVAKGGFDVLDVHYYLSKFLRWRTRDGIHWYPPAVRFVTNLILTHVCNAWGLDLPNKLKLKLKLAFPANKNIVLDECTSKMQRGSEVVPMNYASEEPQKSQQECLKAVGPASNIIENRQTPSALLSVPPLANSTWNFAVKDFCPPVPSCFAYGQFG